MVILLPLIASISPCTAVPVPAVRTDTIKSVVLNATKVSFESADTEKLPLPDEVATNCRLFVMIESVAPLLAVVNKVLIVSFGNL